MVKNGWLQIRLEKEQLTKLDELAELTKKFGKGGKINRSEVLRDLIIDPGFLPAIWEWWGVTIQGERFSPGLILLDCFLAEIMEEMSKSKDNPIGLQCLALRNYKLGLTGLNPSTILENWKLKIAKLYVIWRSALRHCKGYEFHEVSFDEAPGEKYLLVVGPDDKPVEKYITEMKAAMLKQLIQTQEILKGK